MSANWRYQSVPMKFQLGDQTLFAPLLKLQVREGGLVEEARAVAEPEPPADPLEPESQGFLIRSLPVSVEQPKLTRRGGYLCYVPSQFRRYYIDLRQSFDEYKQRFSSKTRSTLQRKVKKYAEHCGGSISWKAYKTVEEMPEYFRHARTISAKTYQKKLLDAGLPDSEDFYRELESLAGENRVRAYILFDGGRPVSYLYCPVHDGVLIYQYLGYDPEYMKYSVGTVLQWLALESLFDEGCFRLFDFTEGESDHKRLFATHGLLCANVFFLKPSLRNIILLQGHGLTDAFSAWVGNTLNRLGLKARIRKLLRFGR